MSREQTVTMMRIKNEGRWISYNLERAWQISQTIVLLDDRSEDETVSIALSSLPCVSPLANVVSTGPVSRNYRTDTKYGACDLHVIHSPFGVYNVRQKERANETRDKNVLWAYVKSCIPDFRYVLNLDGDEMLSRRAIRDMPAAWTAFEAGVDIIHLPFFYLWQFDQHVPHMPGQLHRRVDAIYGDDGFGVPRLRFPRMFTIRRFDEQRLFDSRYEWHGSKAGIHCGAVPMVGFHGMTPEPSATTLMLPIFHFGYIDEQLRQAKFAFYNRIDPDNEFEGYYRHVIGQPNKHAPDPVHLVMIEDD